MLTIPQAGTASATMTSREIADLTGSSHDNVLKTVRRLVAEGVIRANETPYESPQNGQTYSAFALSFRDTMVVVSGYSAELRAKIIDRWQELEMAASPVPAELSRLQVLELAMQSERERLALTEQLAAAAPAVEFVERYVDSTGLKGFRQVAKLLRVKEPEFREFLIDEKILYRLGGEMVPFAPHIDAGRFCVKAGTAGTGHAFNSAKFTAKGIEWVAGELARWQLAQRERREVSDA